MIGTVPQDRISIAQAAMRLRKGYQSALNLALRGEIHAEQDHATRRWYVDRASLEQYLARLNVAGR